MRPVQGRGVALDIRIRLTELEIIWSPANPSRFRFKSYKAHESSSHIQQSVTLPGAFRSIGPVQLHVVVE
jgi:hypothetical protein